MTEIVQGLVTTIIPVYNRPDMVRQAVDSILAQTYRPIEIILVDDGSNDGRTPAVLEDVRVAQPELVSVLRQDNGGAGLAREAGRRIARGEFIQYLDSDDWILPNKFKDQVSALRANPDCGIAYGTSMLVDADGNVINPTSRWTGRTFDYLFPALLRRRWWYTHTPLFRRDVSDAAGEWPRQRPEDWDLEARMGALRTRLVHCGSTVSCQREHQNPDRISTQPLAGYLKDEAWFLPRLYGAALEAGVTSDSKEMQHFAKRVLLRARQLAEIGETDLAWDLMDLAKRCNRNNKAPLTIVYFLAKAVGWRATSRMCRIYENRRG